MTTLIIFPKDKEPLFASIFPVVLVLVLFPTVEDVVVAERLGCAAVDGTDTPRGTNEDIATGVTEKAAFGATDEGVVTLVCRGLNAMAVGINRVGFVADLFTVG